jgi:glycosyltransferase involved in cell wall biosynthesis
MMAARGLLLALDYPPAGGGISRLLDAWTVDTDVIEWQVLSTTPGRKSERVDRSSLRSMLLVATRNGAMSRGDGEERIVVAGHPYLSGLAVAAAGLMRAKSGCAVFGRELVPHNPGHRLALTPLAAIGSVVAISDHSAALAVRAGARRRRVSVVRPRLRPPWLASAAPRRPAWRGLRLVTVSRLSEGYKNLELLLRLVAVLHPLGVVDRFTIIGGGPRHCALREKAAALGVSDVVALPGHLADEEIGPLLRDCDVGLFASRDSIAERGFEGFGLVVHELAAAGLPVLVGAAAGALDAAVAPWARLLDPDDLWSWVEAVTDLHANEAARLALGEAALEWAAAADPTESAREFALALLHPRVDRRREKAG